MKEYIKFELIESKTKTLIYDVINIKGNFSLGKIKWFSRWCQYSFFPIKNTVYSRDCLQVICEMIDELKNARKQVLTTSKNDKQEDK